MSVGVVIVDIVEVAADRWWIDTLEPGSDTRSGHSVAIYCDPRPEQPQVGDQLSALEQVEQHCPCGARPESPKTHPHVIGCPVGLVLAR